MLGTHLEQSIAKQVRPDLEGDAHLKLASTSLAKDLDLQKIFENRIQADESAASPGHHGPNEWRCSIPRAKRRANREVALRSVVKWILRKSHVHGRPGQPADHPRDRGTCSPAQLQFDESPMGMGEA